MLGVHSILLEENAHPELSVFLKKLEQESAYIAPAYISSLLIPYLRDMIQYLQLLGIGLNTPTYQQLVSTILRQYVERDLGTPPHKPRTWTKDARGCKTCNDCRDLDQFLRSPTDQIKRFKVGGGRRNHLQNQCTDRRFRNVGIDLTVTTERVGSPHALVIVKRHQDYEAKAQRWVDAARRAKQSISSVAKVNDLRTLLGDQFDDIANLKYIDRSHQPANGQQVETRPPSKDVSGSTTISTPVNVPSVHGIASTTASQVTLEHGASRATAAQSPLMPGSNNAVKRKADDDHITAEIDSKRAKSVEVIDLTGV